MARPNINGRRRRTARPGKWGSSAGIERGPHGEIWAIDRCGANTCDGCDKNPIVLLDMNTGKAKKAIGAGLFVFPHGLHVDRHGNIWVTDGGVSKDGTKGLQVIELSPDGKVLLRIGTAGQRGDDETHFNTPSDVITNAKGEIFVTDGHAPIAGTIPDKLDMRVMKFDAHGKFIKAWGKPGTKPGEFNNPHALALDGQGRLYVADRYNNRIQIFTQDGKFIAEWKQFGRPSRLLHHRRPALCHRRRLHRGHPSRLEEGRVDRLASPRRCPTASCPTTRPAKAWWWRPTATCMARSTWRRAASPDTSKK